MFLQHVKCLTFCMLPLRTSKPVWKLVVNVLMSRQVGNKEKPNERQHKR